MQVHSLYINNALMIVAGNLYNMLYDDTDDSCMTTETCLLKVCDMCAERCTICVMHLGMKNNRLLTDCLLTLPVQLFRLTLNYVKVEL
jgi:hypothetical protein